MTIPEKIAEHMLAWSVRSNRNKAKALTLWVRNNGIECPLTLYRGMSTDMHRDMLLDQEPRLYSFTLDPHIAMRFASFHDQPYVMQLRNWVGFPIGSNTFNPEQQEWLVCGPFGVQRKAS